MNSFEHYVEWTKCFEHPVELMNNLRTRCRMNEKYDNLYSGLKYVAEIIEL
jgi:hypothetical protein